MRSATGAAVNDPNLILRTISEPVAALFPGMHAIAGAGGARRQTEFDRDGVPRIAPFSGGSGRCRFRRWPNDTASILPMLLVAFMGDLIVHLVLDAAGTPVVRLAFAVARCRERCSC